ncbi:MAG TPA: cupredoxin domain-containing protein [Acidimicrobiia bacterium]|jgi:plastocyanin
MVGDRLGRVPTIALAVVVPLVALVTVVVTLNVTSNDASSASGAAKGATTPNSITIANFQFSPDPLVVATGTEVTVTNDDGTVHTVTATDKSFDTGDLDGGASATITLAKAGTYKYFCNIHNYMTGTIEVK